jgi:hypothetical protein
MVTKALSTFKNPKDIRPNREVEVLKLPLMSTEALERLAGLIENVSTPDFTSVFQNTFQAIYHLIRLDLGVIIDNQIYNSPQMFNLSIMPTNPEILRSRANDSRIATSNSTLMAQWRERVAFFQTSDRIPVMDYLRPVQRLKPLGSAITSVFVSTFAMFSALWTIFSLGAGALARRTGQSPVPSIFISLPHVKTLKPQPDNDYPRTRIRRKQFLARAVGLLSRDLVSTYMQKTLDGIWAPHPASLFTRSPHQHTFGSNI